MVGGDAGDVKYPLHLFNGRTPSDPDTLSAKAGDRVVLKPNRLKDGARIKIAEK